jgi:alpha-1,3-rhamnosyl/mannosyltransferase
LSAYRVDVVFNPGFTAPLAARCPSVTVIHDLQHKRFPQFFRRRDLPFWNLLVWLAAERSDRLIAVSDATARDIAKYMHRHEAKTSLVPHGVDPEFHEIRVRRFESGLGTAGTASFKYVLAVATSHPHKNLERLLEAFSAFVKTGRDYRLVVAGLKGFAARHLEKRGQELLGGRVCFTGWIPRDRLYDLFANAAAFISPSLFEGFGLPVVEALAAGIPTACSAIPVYDSVSGSAAVRFNPLCVSEIAGALERITEDPDFRDRAANAGPEQARNFDWNRSAAMTLRELKRAVGISAEDPTGTGKNSEPIPSS